MAPNQYGEEDVSLMLELETRQRQDEAAREALGEAPPRPKPAPKKRAQRAERPTDRA